MFRYFTLFFAISFFQPMGVLFAQYDAEEGSQFLKELHEAFQEIRQNEYGDVHFVVRFTEEASNGYLEEKLIKYWARDNQYFRIDEEVFDGERSIGFTQLLIRPEGSVLRTRTPTGLAVKNFASYEEGFERLQVAEFYCNSTRFSKFLDAEILFGAQEGIAYTTGLSEKLAKDNFKPLRLNGENDIVTLETRFRPVLEEFPDVTLAIRFDAKRKVILNVEQIDHPKGAFSKKDESTREYDFNEFKHIPKKAIYIEDSRGILVKKEYVMESIDWSRVPMEIFELEERFADKYGVWMRRLVFLGIGLFTLVIIYRFARSKQ